MANAEIVVYKGIIFRRYPDAKRRADRVYYTPGGGDRARGVKRLHQEIWQDHHGPIPPGHVIHHQDENPDNNEPDNLVAVPFETHQRGHPKAARPGPAHLDRIRPLSHAWRRTPEGRAWHREHARRSFAKVESREYDCFHCGTRFTSKPIAGKDDRRACSHACQAAARRASGLDDENRVCVRCGETFRVNRYRKTPTCSRVCGQALRPDRGRQG